MWIIGVDPGAFGGLALTCNGVLVEYERMPPLAGMADFFQNAINAAKLVDPVICIFEQQKGGGADTNASAHWHAGWYSGAISALCAANGVRFIPVTPQEWKKELGLILRIPKGEKVSHAEKRKMAKSQSCELAKQLFPDLNLIFPRCRIEHDGVAEAALLAEYGRRKWGK